MIDILMGIGLILLIMSLCTLFSTNNKVRKFNLVVNTLMVGDFMIKNILEGDTIMTIVFGTLFVIDLLFLIFWSSWYNEMQRHENMKLGDKVDELFERNKFLNDIKKKYGSTRH